MPRWSIRNKLLVCIALLVAVVITLTWGAFSGVYAYRGLAKSLGVRAAELPLASEMAGHVSDLRVTLSKTRRLRESRILSGDAAVDSQSLREQFRISTQLYRDSLRRYRDQLEISRRNHGEIGGFDGERETIAKIEDSLARIDRLNQDEDWVLDEINVEMLHEELGELHRLTNELPSHLQGRMESLASEVRIKYRSWIALTAITSLTSVGMLFVLSFCVYSWVFKPLRELIRGSRIVAGGKFNYRIPLSGNDEIAELADAMNAMTERFQEVKSDLDQKVRERTMEAVRSEQLASVGVLAAGVAHEINNPLASIAFRAEALEARLYDIIAADDSLSEDDQDGEFAVVRSYLDTIQEEAFRCKGITERLLDFSREGNHERTKMNLAELTDGVIDMVRHLGKYREKEIALECDEPVYAYVDPQELKQVMLNLITNGLDALDAGGTLTIRVSQKGDQAELLVIDNGCGMSPETLARIFEPFFTSRKDGSGNGLGLAITHRIIEDHGGRIVATSDGPGCGSQFRVTLPIQQHEKEQQAEYQAA